MIIAVNTRFLIKNRLEGIGWFTYETLSRITSSHPEHQFVFLFDRSFDESFLFSSNIKPVVLPPPARHPLLWYLWFEWSVPYALKKHRADFFLSTDGFTSLKSKCKSLLVVHDLAFEHFGDHVAKSTARFYRKNTPAYCRHASRIATVSEFTRNDLVEQYKIPAAKIDVVYNGAHQAYQPLSDEMKAAIRKQYSDGKPYFVFVSAIHPRKNVARIFEAFDRFRENNARDFRLLIAGRKAWQYAEILRTYENMKHRDAVVFLDHLPPQQLAEIVAASHALLYPSLFEGFGIPIVEAMYAETAVVTSNCSSMPEVAGNAALLVNPESVDAITNSMHQLANDEALRNELIQRGKVQRNRFSWDKTAELLWKSMEETMQ
jgi:glycosyltransferase involved in cell wall biosynthesis